MKYCLKKIFALLVCCSTIFATAAFSACNAFGENAPVSSDTQSESSSSENSSSENSSSEDSSSESSSSENSSIEDSESSVCEHIYDNACDNICNVCNEERTVPDHVYDNDCDTTCNVCTAKRTVPDHVYDNDCDTTCNVCTAERTVPDHVYDNDCDTTCNVCTAERTVPDHVYDNDCDTACNVCSAERTVPDHVYDNDCDTNCNVCTAERSVPDHVYDNDCDANCNVCTAERTVPDHVYDNDCDTACNVCTAERSVPDHVYDDSYDGNCNSCGQTRIVPDQGDLADLAYASSKIINNWMAVSDLTLQNECVSENSASAIKGEFNYRMGEAYTGAGGNQIWTAVCFDLKAYFGENQNLQGKVVSFDLKTDNCQNTPSLFVTNASGQKQTEYAFDTQAQDSEIESGIVKTVLSNGWVRISVYAEYLYDSEQISQTQSFSLVFSNVGCNENENSVFYIDNFSVQAGDLPWFTDVYNPTGYYSKDEKLTIKVVGNSFIYHSDTAAWLQIFADLNGASLNATFSWTSGGRIPDQYEAAFGENGWMDGEYSPNLVYVQDFYSLGDAFALNDFARTMRERSPNTEIKIYPGENETEDGILAAKKLGLDLVNWRAAVKELKTKGFTATHLNDPVDGWHPSELAGVVGALMIYMDLYGEMPTFYKVWPHVLSQKDLYNKLVSSYLPGENDNDKKLALASTFKLAAAYENLGDENILIDDDFAATPYLSSSAFNNYMTTATLTEQTEVVSQNSSVAIKGTFTHVGADAYTQTGANQIWCGVLLDLTAIYNTAAPSITGKTISFDIKTENCGTTCSTLLIHPVKGRTNEPIFDNTATSQNAGMSGYTKTILSNGWVRITADIDILFESQYSNGATTYAIVLNNVDTDESKECVFYLDNIRIS